MSGEDAAPGGKRGACTSCVTTWAVQDGSPALCPAGCDVLPCLFAWRIKPDGEMLVNLSPEATKAIRSKTTRRIVLASIAFICGGADPKTVAVYNTGKYSTLLPGTVEGLKTVVPEDFFKRIRRSSNTVALQLGWLYLYADTDTRGFLKHFVFSGDPDRVHQMELRHSHRVPTSLDLTRWYSRGQPSS